MGLESTIAAYRDALANLSAKEKALEAANLAQAEAEHGVRWSLDVFSRAKSEMLAEIAGNIDTGVIPYGHLNAE